MSRILEIHLYVTVYEPEAPRCHLISQNLMGSSCFKTGAQNTNLVFGGSMPHQIVAPGLAAFFPARAYYNRHY